MKFKLLLIVSLSFLSIMTFSQVTVKLGSVENAEPGTYVNIPLIVTGLSETGQGFIGLEVLFLFQDNIISFDSLANGNPITPVNQWFAGSANGKVSANWLEPNIQPVYVEENAVLVDFVFFYSGGQTDLVFDPNGTVIYDINSNPISISAFIDGMITQGEGSDNSEWNGEGDWTSVSNWSNGIPGDNTNAIINSGAVACSSGGVCHNLTIRQGTRLVIKPASSLTINGNLDNSGTFEIEADSLIQGSLIISGTITQGGTSSFALQVFDGINYQFTSPVVGSTAALFDGIGIVKTHQENTNEWTVLSSASSFVQGKGYATEISADETVNFEGMYNSAAVSVELAYSATGNPAEEGWNLIGNPFTSSFDTDSDLATVAADRAIYTWDGYRYRVWNGVAGNIPGGIIPPATAFFIKANNTGASASFETTGKMHDFSHFGNSYANPENVLQVNLWDFDGVEQKDVTYLQIEENSTFGYDGQYDALKLENPLQVPELYISSQNIHFMISAIPEAVEAIVGIRAPVDGAFRINAVTFDFLPERPVFLIDQETQNTRDLRTETYSFNMTAGDYPERFKIILSGLGTDEIKEETGLKVYAANGNICVHSIAVHGNSILTIHDLSGRIREEDTANLQQGSTVYLKGFPGFNILTVKTEAGNFRYKLILR
jgi:hypothetical protein